MKMQFSYSDGQFIEGDFSVSGQIILSENKLFLKDSYGDITRTYLPLDKIDRLKRQGASMWVSIKASMSFQYNVQIKGEKKSIIEFNTILNTNCAIFSAGSTPSNSLKCGSKNFNKFPLLLPISMHDCS